MIERKLYAATNENLKRHALAPAMRWLIAAALDGSTMTYGELKQKLETEAGFSKIFATRIGFVAGALMGKIQETRPDAPLINVLVVNQQDRQPSEGAGSFMADRFGDTRLERKDAKEHYPKLWEQTFHQAAGEVYKLRDIEWERLFEEVFKLSLHENAIVSDREQRKKGLEEDGIPVGRKYGKGGEGPFHKALRIWVMKNPHEIHSEFKDFTAETEVDLDSGDRIDVVYKGIQRTIVIEVKSRVSNEIDLRRGVFQCIKYRAVRQAMDVRENSAVEAYLVTEEALPGEIAALVKHHKIRHVQAPLERD